MTPEQTITRYAAVARPLILQFFPPNACIAASRITIECLGRFGIKAKAFPMKFAVESTKHQVRFTVGLDDKEKAEAAANAASSHSRMGLKAWNGHVVVITKGKGNRYLIDASFDQASMPAHGVPIKPHVLVVPIGKEIPPEDIFAELGLVTDGGEDLNVKYIPLRDRSFLDAPAWETDHLQPVIAMICRRMAEATQ